MYEFVCVSARIKNVQNAQPFASLRMRKGNLPNEHFFIPVTFITKENNNSSHIYRPTVHRTHTTHIIHIQNRQTHMQQQKTTINN